VFDNLGGVCVHCVYEERGRCLTTLVGCICGHVCECEERGKCLTTLVECICVCMCVYEERGRCLTTLVGCVYVYVSVDDERGKCLTTLDGCVWVLSSVVSVVLSSSSSSLPFCWLFCFIDVRKRRGERGGEEKMYVYM